jgi:hypothetical protein
MINELTTYRESGRSSSTELSVIQIHGFLEMAKQSQFGFRPEDPKCQWIKNVVSATA